MDSELPVFFGKYLYAHWNLAVFEKIYLYQLKSIKIADWMIKLRGIVCDFTQYPYPGNISEKNIKI